MINDSDLFSRDYLLSYCLESLSYSAWFTMCLTYRRLSLKLMKAIRRRLFPPISMTHHLSSCLKLSSDGNTFLRSSGRLKVPLHKTLYVRSIAAASFGYFAAASRKGFLDITCNRFLLPKSFLFGNYERDAIPLSRWDLLCGQEEGASTREGKRGRKLPGLTGSRGLLYRRSQSSSQEKMSLRRTRPTGGGRVVRRSLSSREFRSPASGARRRASACCDARQRTN